MKRVALTILQQLAIATLPAVAQQIFTNQIATSGLTSAQGNVAAIYDHDNDGLLDLVWASGNPAQRSLMRNNGDLTFTDISAVSGFTDPSGGMNPVDIDNNGWTDIIWMDLTANTITLLMNTGGSFTTQLIQLPVDLHHGFSLFDLDRDGAVDILSSVASGGQIHLMVGHNDVCTIGPEGAFQNWTTIAGPFQVPEGAVMITSILDHDNDGDLDLLVVHETNGAPLPGYHYQPLLLFRNDGGTFTNITAASGLGVGHRNGPTFWDYNNDGYLDVLFGYNDCCDQLRMNLVYRNNGNGTFTDLGGSLGLRSGNTYYFPPEIVDLENDGDEDVVWDIWSSSYTQQVYINTGGSFGSNQASTYGLALPNENPFAFDVDNDGDMDLICGSHGEFPDSARLMVNPLRQNNITITNYLNIVLKGCASGRSGINSLVRVYRQGAVLAKQTHGLQHNYDESAPDHLHFGMGTATQADSVVVHWPSGAVTRSYNIPANQQFIIEETPGCSFAECLPVVLPIDCEGVAGGSALPGTPCDDGINGTIDDTWTNDCQCQGTPTNCTENITLNITVDAFGSQTTWTIFEAGTSNVVTQGGPYPDGIGGSVIIEERCVPAGCYRLVVNDAAGDGITGGGYVLRTSGSNGQRIIDNSNNGGFTSTSAIIGGAGFCLPVGNDRLIFTSCDKLDWVSGQFIAAAPNPAVSALWVPDAPNNQQSSTTGYQFWFFDPNGTYGYARFRSHATSDGYPAEGPTRACHLRINNWSPNQIPTGVLMNVKVRSRIDGVNSTWGPACRFKIDPVQAACPLTKLNDIPGSVTYSCGVTRGWGGSNRLWARPVEGATQYQFRFENGEITPLVRTTTTQTLTLDWTPALPAGTYAVQVRAFKNGQWCATNLPWGDVCNVTITGTQAGNGMRPAGGADLFEASLAMFPNPNNGDQLTVSLSAVEEGVQTVSVDIFDLNGARVSAQTLAVNDGMLFEQVAVNDLASGLYMVNITAGGKRYTERLAVYR